MKIKVFKQKLKLTYNCNELNTIITIITNIFNPTILNVQQISF